MVHDKKENVVFLVAPQQSGAQQRTAGEIERTLRHLRPEPDHLGVLCFLVEMTQVDHGQRQRKVGKHDLYRFAAHGIEHGPQRFMAPDDFVDGAL